MSSVILVTVSLVMFLAVSSPMLRRNLWLKRNTAVFYVLLHLYSFGSTSEL